MWPGSLRCAALPKINIMSRPSPLPDLPDDDVSAYEQVDAFASDVAGNLQLHRCLIASCGKPPGGRLGCRMHMPRASGPEQAFTHPTYIVHRAATKRLEICSSWETCEAGPYLFLVAANPLGGAKWYFPKWKVVLGLCPPPPPGGGVRQKWVVGWAPQAPFSGAEGAVKKF